jgi:kynurenine formamidase
MFIPRKLFIGLPQRNSN